MEILIRDTPAEVATAAADIVAAYVRKKNQNPDRSCVLGLATGSTPVATYQELIRRHREEGLSFAGLTAFCLDEYIGLPREHRESYYRFIRDNFTAHIDIADDAVNSPDGMDPQPWKAAERYDAAIKAAGGIDVQILGIGSNGHIGFNEPGSPLRGRTRVETLHPQTIRDNARFFQDDVEDVPTHAITQGLGTILDSDHLVLLATGESKAYAVHSLVEGPITTSIPASMLQLADKATVIVDESAASMLREREYYRHREELRPSWMGPDMRPIED